MAKDQTKRLPPKTLQADTDALAALSSVAGYAPSKPECSVQSVQTLADTMKAAQDIEVQAYGTADEKRDGATGKEWEFHNRILSVKQQVLAQYGEDSDELQRLGRKKKSEYKKPGGRKKAKT